jgi:hypothetical protein
VDASSAEVKALAKYYATSVDVEGGKLTPVLPGVGWLLDLTNKSAFYVADVDNGRLKSLGAEKGDILVVQGGAATDDERRQLVASALGAGNAVLHRGRRYETAHAPVGRDER